VHNLNVNIIAEEAGEQAIRELRDLGVTAKLAVLEMDVTNNDHLTRAVESVRAHYGKLDGLSCSQHICSK
jgi:enoyl-[acyl-carrier-protein] reductase (NADH)